MNTNRLNSYLAGLLHGIGEFHLLAKDPAARASYATIAEASAAFIDAQKAVLSKLFEDPEDFQQLQASVLTFARSETSSAQQLNRAISLARGVELPQTVPRDISQQQHVGSIFESLVKEVNDNFIPQYALPAQELTLSSAFFPKKHSELPTPKWPHRWQAFETAFAQLQTSPKGVDSFLDSLLSLLERHTHTVPSVLSGLTDVSLFDHLKTTAAFNLALEDAQEERFLLVSGDISGIQTYIYDILSKYAAKNLKGRSFYLQLLADAVLKYLLRELELPRAQVVYASGGGFYVLAADTEANQQKLQALSTQLNESFFEAHKADLYLALGWQAFTSDEVFAQNIGEVWRTLGNISGKKKRQRYAAQMVNQYEQFFGPQGKGGEAVRDVITGEEIPDGKHEDRSDEDATEPLLVHQDTAAQIDLGKKLWQTTVLVSSWKKQPILKNAYCFIPPTIKHYYYLLNEDNQHLAAGLPAECSVQTFNPGLADDRLPNISNPNWGFTFYGGNQYPTNDKKEPRTFNHLAGRPDEDEGRDEEKSAFSRLGVLRMDVDSLGRTIIQGMHASKKNFARYSCLSRNLDWFFKGYLNQIWADDPDFKEKTQILYSGGDDLFLVGRWDLLITFAQKIKEGFAKWTCQNEYLSLSGGMAIVTPKYPISKGAEEAKEAEEAAKGHSYHHTPGDPKAIKEKNAFCFLGLALNWDHEYTLVEELKKLLVELIDGPGEQKVSRSLLGRIRSHHYDAQQAKQKDLTESWRWKMAYDFARFAKTQKDLGVREKLEQLKKGAFTGKFGTHHTASPNHNFLDLLNLASRWAELEIRTQQII